MFRLYYYRLQNDDLLLIKKVSGRYCSESEPTFFKADSIKTIKENCKEIEGECVDDMALEKFEIGKKYRFKAGDPFTFIGVVKGEVEFFGDRHLEIEIVPKKLYFYSYIDEIEVCDGLEILEEISE